MCFSAPDWGLCEPSGDNARPTVFPFDLKGLRGGTWRSLAVVVVCVIRGSQVDRATLCSVDYFLTPVGPGDPHRTLLA